MHEDDGRAGAQAAGYAILVYSSRAIVVQAVQCTAWRVVSWCCIQAAAQDGRGAAIDGVFRVDSALGNAHQEGYVGATGVVQASVWCGLCDSEQLMYKMF